MSAVNTKAAVIIGDSTVFGSITFNREEFLLRVGEISNFKRKVYPCEPQTKPVRQKGSPEYRETFPEFPTPCSCVPRSQNIAYYM